MEETIHQSHQGLEEKNDALQKCEQEVAEWKDKYLRVTADFQNYKKRAEKEQSNLAHLIKTNLLLDILAIVDNFDRALEEVGTETFSQQQGFAMIRREFYKFLEKQGVKEFESYDTFNPELHEAIMEVDSEKHQPGSIVEVLQKGYMLNGQILRPAKVSVAK